MYNNSPFRNKSIDKANSAGRLTTSNSEMSKGAGDPPTGTATTKTKLETAMEIYESKNAKLQNMKGSVGKDALRKDVQAMSERIKAMPGGVDAFQAKTGKIGVGSESGKALTTKDISKMTGESESKVKKNIQTQAGGISGARVRKGMIK